MTAIPSDLHPVDAAERLEAPQRNPLSGRATAYLLSVIALTVAVSAPVHPRPRARGGRRRLADLRDPRHGGGDRPALHGAVPVEAPVVPHVDRLPARRGAAAPAGARRPHRDRPEHPGVAEGAVHLVRPELQHLQLHAQRPGRVGGVPPDPQLGRADRERGRARRRSAPAPPASCSSSRTTSCSRRCCASGAGSRSARRSSSRSRACPPTSSSRRLGVALATFWTWNPWLIPVALSPLLVLHRSLSVPQLQAEARVDPKTGLFNARYFATALNEELARAARFNRPMSLIMADLDLLRDINNTYGHLAGDAVLQGHRRGLPGPAAPLRRPGALRRRGVLHPPARDAAGAGARDRGAHPPGRGRARVRGRDGVRADPGHRLDRRRRVPEGRDGRERAHPPGRPRRLPRQAPGPQPRARRQRGAAPHARRPPVATRRRAGGGRPPRAAPGRPGGAPGRRAAPSAPARAQRAAVPLALDQALAPRRNGLRRRRRGRHRRRRARDEHRLDRPPRGDRARRRRAGARARGDGPGHALGLRRRHARRRRALRPQGRAGARRDDRRGGVERPPAAGPQRPLQRRQPHVRVARGRRGLRPRRRPQAAHGGRGHRRRRGLLRREHGPALARARAGGPRALVARLPRALRVAAPALRRLRLHRRRDRDRLPVGRPLRARRVRGAAAPHAQDAGGLPGAHAALGAEAPRGGRDDPDARTSRSSRRTGC